MRSAFVLTIIFALVPVILKRPYLGIYGWYWIALLNPHELAWGIAQEFPVALIIALATLIGFLFMKEKKSLPRSNVVILILIFVFWFSLSTVFSENPISSYDKWKIEIKIFLFTGLTIILINNRERAHGLIWIISSSLGYFGIKGGIFTIIKGGQERVWGPPDTFIADNNALGMSLAMTLPLFWYLYRQTENLYVRAGIAGAGALSFLAIIGTHSRGALLAVIATGMVLWLISRRRILIGMIAVTAVMATFAMAPEKWFERMESIQAYEQDSSAQGRLRMWRFATNIAIDRPVLGGGFNVFFEEDIRAQYGQTGKSALSVHSAYFEILGEHGFVGLFIYIALGIACLSTILRLRRFRVMSADSRWINHLSEALLSSLAAFAVGGAFLNLAYFDLAFGLVALIVITDAIAKREMMKVNTMVAEEVIDDSVKKY